MPITQPPGIQRAHLLADRLFIDSGWQCIRRRLFAGGNVREYDRGLAFVAALAVLAGPSVRLHHVTVLRRPGLLGAFVYGLVFSLGTPAVSLLLVLTVAAAEDQPAYGALLALGYGIGRGLPFLLFGLCSGAAIPLRCQPSWSRAVQVTTDSLLLLITGYYLWIFLRLS